MKCAAFFYFFVVLIAAMLFLGCQKAKPGNMVLNSTTSAIPKGEVPAASRKPQQGSVNYGARVLGPDRTTNYDFEIGVAKQLGISCLREAVIVPGKNLDSVLVSELNSRRYKIILNFNSPGKGDKTIPFRTDITQYKQDLNDVLKTFTVMPVVATIENEESNQSFFSGTAQEYINQLDAAIEVMHARGIKVTNGGITKPGLCYLVYQDYLAQNKNDSAQMFLSWSGIRPGQTSVQQRGAFIDTLLQAYTINDVDYVNFHWKGANSDSTQAFNAVINYLTKRTGKPVLSNELGQVDTDPNTLTAHVQVCFNYNFPYIIWFSPDPKYGQADQPLQNSDGTLTPSGYAYKNFIAIHK